MEMIAKEILKKARAKIAKPENWCQGVSARKKVRSILYDFNDVLEACDARDPEACQWCATGAIDGVIPRDSYLNVFGSRKDALRVLDRFCPESSVVAYNDGKENSHESIISIFDKAIEFFEIKDELE